ncbi:SCP-like protein [Oesophagostomum dentatum]|uniref:SCP-like protein n=1 Tax=Oesophagostomum dentatum TaxID=61180 RepID=A0A0B1SRB6_OESDE|nr:SCP-like protein [Oesophagostomum dentatum]
MHNIRRSALANGTVTNTDGVALPKGNNILQMEIDCTLEAAATAIAANCFADSPNPGTGISENRAEVLLTGVPDKLTAIEKGVSSWWKQIRTVTPTISTTVTYDASHAAIIDFVHMAWAPTYKLGCGINKCTNFYAVVCQYSPSDLAYGNQIYEIGNPCTNCPAGFNTCTDYLCVADHQQRKFLDLHNTYRSSLANGEVVKVNGNKLPKGSNILKMEIDCDLEAEATAIAAACFADSPNPGTGISESREQVPLDGTPDKLTAIEKVDLPVVRITRCGKRVLSSIVRQT